MIIISRKRIWVHVGNSAELCRPGLFQDSDFAGELEDSKKINIGRYFTHLRESDVRSDQLDVQENKLQSHTVQSQR